MDNHTNIKINSNLRGSLIEQQRQLTAGLLKGSHSFNSAFASDIDSINNDLKDLFPSEQNTPIQGQKFASGYMSKLVNQRQSYNLQPLHEDENENNLSISQQQDNKNKGNNTNQHYENKDYDNSPLQRIKKTMLQQNIVKQHSPLKQSDDARLNLRNINSNSVSDQNQFTLNKLQSSSKVSSFRDLDTLKLKILQSEEQTPDNQIRKSQDKAQWQKSNNGTPFHLNNQIEEEYYSGRFNQNITNQHSRENSQLRYSEQKLQQNNNRSSQQSFRQLENQHSKFRNNSQMHNKKPSNVFEYQGNNMNLDQESQYLQQIMLTTLDELQLETQDGYYDMPQQHQIFNHGRNPSQMEMRDLIELAHQDSAFLENNPIFDFNYLNEESNKSTDRNNMNINTYQEYLEQQKTKEMASKKPPINHHKNLSQFSVNNNSSNNQSEIKESARNLQNKYRTIQINQLGNNSMEQQQQDQKQQDKSNKTLGQDRFRNNKFGNLQVQTQKIDEKDYNETSQILGQLKQNIINPVLSPLRSRLKNKNNSLDYNTSKDKTNDSQDQKSQLKDITNDNMQSPLLPRQKFLQSPQMKPQISAHSPMLNNNKLSDIVDQYKNRQGNVASLIASGIDSSSNLQDSQSSILKVQKPLSKAQMLERRRLAGNSSQIQTINNQNVLNLPPQYPGGEGTFSQNKQSMFNNTLNEQQLPSIKNSDENMNAQRLQLIGNLRKSNNISQKSYEVKNSNLSVDNTNNNKGSDLLINKRQNSDLSVQLDDYGRPIGQLIRQFNDQKLEEEKLRKEALEKEKHDQLLKQNQNEQLLKRNFKSKFKSPPRSTGKHGTTLRSKSPSKQQQLSSRIIGSFTMDDLKSNLFDIDKQLTSLENKPYERIVRLEQEKLRVMQEAAKQQSGMNNQNNSVIKVDVKYNHGEISQGDESPTTRRRNRFRALLSKYTDQPLSENNQQSASQAVDQTRTSLDKRQQQSTYTKLRELDKMHQRNDDEVFEEQTQENNLLRQKLKIVNEYLSKIVETQITKQEQQEEYDKKWNIKQMSMQKQQERAKIFAEKTLSNSIKHEGLLKKEYSDTLDLCSRIAQPNYIDHLEKRLKELGDQIQRATVQKNNLSIKQKMLYKIDLSKKEIDQEKKIISLESELERNAEKINDIMQRRQKIQSELQILNPKVTELQVKRDNIKAVYDASIMKTENMYLTHKLPLMQKHAKSKETYGQIIDKLHKDLKAKKDDIEVMKKLFQVKTHQIDTLGIKLIKVIKLLKLERDTKENSLKDQRIIVEYLEKAIEFEKQQQNESMTAEIKQKLQKQLLALLFRPKEQIATIEEHQSGDSGTYRENQIQKSNRQMMEDINGINLDLGEAIKQDQGIGIIINDNQNLNSKFDFYDQIVFPNQDADINEMLDKFRNPTFENQALIIAGQHNGYNNKNHPISLYNLHKFQGQKSHNLIDDREAADEQQSLEQSILEQKQLQLQQLQQQMLTLTTQSQQQQNNKLISPIQLSSKNNNNTINQNTSIVSLSEESKTPFSMKSVMNQIGISKQKLLNNSNSTHNQLQSTAYKTKTQQTLDLSKTRKISKIIPNTQIKSINNKYNQSSKTLFEKDLTLTTNKNEISSLNGSFMNAIVKNKQSSSQLINIKNIHTSNTPKYAANKSIKIPTINI